MTLFLSTILDRIGSCILFFFTILRSIHTKGVDSRWVCEQIWKVARDSAGITITAGFFVGAIMTVQFGMQMKEFDALTYLGGLSTSGTFREIGPLLIAFLLRGKIGAFTAAELGTMRVTEQIDAIRCLGADPIQEIIVPRFLGILITSCFLLFLGLTMSVFGGMLVGKLIAGLEFEEYLRHIPHILTWFSIFSGFMKALIFGTLLGVICTYFGFNATGGAKGVGQAVVITAVSTMVSIVVFDWFTTFIGDVVLNLARGYR
ncbi:MAG TPA: ABC transporter permease [Pseudobdellovibrionaceae bacterium]|nr:ABC transporter permease [Pseudobdellovibrionaceae bacterium]